MPGKKEKRPLSVTHPELAIWLVDRSLASLLTRGSEKIVEWKCELGHLFLKSPSTIKKTPGCPYCHGTKVLIGFNDLLSQYPKIAGELVDLDPRLISKGSKKRCNWKCGKGHIWEAAINSRTSNQSGCPYCSGAKIIEGVSDFETLFPEIARQALGWNPSKFGRASKSKVEWKCTNGHIFRATISDRAMKNSGCPFCSGNKVLEGFNDLATTFPTLSLEADDWDPKKVSAGSGKSVGWICNLGHRWRSSPQSRALDKTGCPFCSGSKVLKGFNDLKTTHPDFAEQAFGWDPSSVTYGNRTTKEWKCSEGHIYKASPNGRTTRELSSGCPYCSGKKILPGFNDLLTTFPSLALQALDWDPKKYTAGSVAKLWWKCSSGHKWKTSPNSRTSRNTGCPTCADSGFDPNEDGFIYLIIHPNWLMLQIGITNNPDKRIDSHKKLGWELIELRGPMDGHLTRQWETGILRMLKAKGADLSNSKIAGKFDGYSEAWSKSTFEVKSIKELMKSTEEFEEK